MDHPVDDSGQSAVRATMDGATRHVDTTEFVDGDEHCLGVRFSLLDNGGVTYWTKAVKRCGNSTVARPASHPPSYLTA